MPLHCNQSQFEASGRWRYGGHEADLAKGDALPLGLLALVKALLHGKALPLPHRLAPCTPQLSAIQQIALPLHLHKTFVPRPHPPFPPRVFAQKQASQKSSLGTYSQHGKHRHRSMCGLPVGLAGGFALAMSLSTMAAAGVLAALLGLMTVPRRVVPSTFTAGATGAAAGVAVGAASSTLCPLACSHSSAVHALDSGSFHTCKGVKTD